MRSRPLATAPSIECGLRSCFSNRCNRYRCGVGVGEVTRRGEDWARIHDGADTMRFSVRSQKQLRGEGGFPYGPRFADDVNAITLRKRLLPASRAGLIRR